jgi:hypothetical protein
LPYCPCWFCSLVFHVVPSVIAKQSPPEDGQIGPKHVVKK